MKELTQKEIQQVNGGWVPLAIFAGRVAIGWASSVLYNKAM
jgi:lactobin A/cerein 7B family class IIb bacteriocin